MIKITKIISLLLLLTILPLGCMVGPKYARPEEQKVSSYKYSPEGADT